MPDLTAIKGAVDGLKAAKDIVQAAVALRDAQLIDAKLRELNSVLLTTQAHTLQVQVDQLSMLERVRTLEAEIARFETWEAEKQRYELYAHPGTAGSLRTYRLKDGMAGGEPPHEICPNCYEQRRKSILQPLPGPQRTIALTCPACKTALSTYEQ